MIVKHICLALSTWHIAKEKFINLYKFKKKGWLRSFLISFKDAENHYCIPWNWKSLKALCRSAFLFWIKRVFLLFLIASLFLSNLIKMDFLMWGGQCLGLGGVRLQTPWNNMQHHICMCIILWTRSDSQLDPPKVKIHWCWYVVIVNIC